MPDITIKVRGLEQVKKFISDLPRKVRGLATEAAAEYLIGDDRHGLKHYPSWKRLFRHDVYKDVYFTAKDGHKVYGFSSLRQLRKVAAIMNEKPPSEANRTFAYKNSWNVQGNGVKTVIYGTLPHEKWVDRFSKKIGWRSVSDIISTNYRGAIQAAERAIQKLFPK